MPGPAAIPLIAAGSSILNTASQWLTNNASRKFSLQMYDRMRQDSLADWAMQNEYNSPKAQMERLRDANLNPNLVYGNGAATSTAGVPRGSTNEGWRPQAPQVDTNSLMMFYDVQLKEAQKDNVEQQTKVAQQEVLLKAAEIAGKNAGTAKTMADTEMSKFQLGQAQRLQDIVIKQAEQNLEKTKVNIMYTLNQNERAAVMTTTSVREAAERILTMRLNRSTVPLQQEQIRTQLRNIEKDIELKQLDLNLKRLGLQPTDELWQRVLGRVIGVVKDKVENQGPTKDEMYQEFADELMGNY